MPALAAAALGVDASSATECTLSALMTAAEADAREAEDAAADKIELAERKTADAERRDEEAKNAFEALAAERDAINEPYRPIPSGAISELEVYSQIAFLLVGSIVVALQLDGWAGNDWPVITAIAAFGSFVAYIYSAPPLKLKANGWTGTYALGSSYIALPWWCGHAMFNAGSISAPEVVLTILYSIAGLGIAIVNDFKSIAGDRALGMTSLPVAFGIDPAKWICVAQISFLQDPVNNDVKYQAAAQPFLVFGILTTALAVGHHTF